MCRTTLNVTGDLVLATVVSGGEVDTSDAQELNEADGLPGAARRGLTHETV